jgi:hypothetical protein
MIYSMSIRKKEITDCIHKVNANLQRTIQIVQIQAQIQCTFSVS